MREKILERKKEKGLFRRLFWDAGNENQTVIEQLHSSMDEKKDFKLISGLEKEFKESLKRQAELEKMLNKKSSKNETKENKVRKSDKITTNEESGRVAKKEEKEEGRERE